MPAIVKGKAIGIAAAGLVVVGAGMLMLRTQLAPELDPVDDLRQVAPPPGPPRLTVDVAKQERIRRVASEVVAQPQVAPRELQRVEPREPLSRFARPLPPRPKNQGRIFRPLVMAAGQVAGSGLTVTIAGIEVTGPDASCSDANGAEWPCGVRARAAFRAFVRGRALACDLPEELTEKHYTVACTLGKQDVGAWLVGQGWAKAAPGGPYAQAGEAARAAGKGIFGMAPVMEPVELPPVAEVALPAEFLPLPLE